MSVPPAPPAPTGGPDGRRHGGPRRRADPLSGTCALLAPRRRRRRDVRRGRARPGRVRPRPGVVPARRPRVRSRLDLCARGAAGGPRSEQGVTGGGARGHAIGSAGGVRADAGAAIRQNKQGGESAAPRRLAHVPPGRFLAAAAVARLLHAPRSGRPVHARGQRRPGVDGGRAVRVVRRVRRARVPLGRPSLSPVAGDVGRDAERAVGPARAELRGCGRVGRLCRPRRVSRRGGAQAAAMGTCGRHGCAWRGVPHGRRQP